MKRKIKMGKHKKDDRVYNLKIRNPDGSVIDQFEGVTKITNRDDQTSFYHGDLKVKTNHLYLAIEQEIKPEEKKED